MPRFALAGQQDVEIEHAVERAGPQVGAVEQHRQRAGLLAELGGERGDGGIDRAVQRRAEPRGEGAAHGTTKRSLGPSESR